MVHTLVSTDGSFKDHLKYEAPKNSNIGVNCYNLKFLIWLKYNLNYVYISS
jgi:hypothetical protein